MTKAATLAIGLLFVVGGCAKSATPDQRDAGPERPSTPPQTQMVDWETYSPTAQAGIDQLSAARDCAGLQEEFATADDNSVVQQELVGDGNTDLMTYIDGKLAEAGCYD